MDWSEFASHIQFYDGSDFLTAGDLGSHTATPAEQSQILGWLKHIFDDSLTGRSMLENAITLRGSIRILPIDDTSTNNPAYVKILATGDYIALNVNKLDNVLSFNTEGDLVHLSPEHIIAHEMAHYAYHTLDPHYDIAAEKNGTDFDYDGAQVRMENTVGAELGQVDETRASYEGAGLDDGVIMSLFDSSKHYTGGEHIDFVRIAAYEVGLSGGAEFDFQNRTDSASILAFSFDGDDRMLGGGGKEWMYLGAGDDQAEGGGDSDHLFGQQGDDDLKGDQGDDFLFGGSGSDSISGGDGDDTLYGADDVFGLGAGDDTLKGEAGNDSLYGGAGDDNLAGGDGDDWQQGGAGNDHIEGGGGRNILLGEAGDDTIIGGGGNNVLVGDASPNYFGVGGNDRLEGGPGDDRLYGNDGDDTLLSGLGWGYVEGGNGNDKIRVDGDGTFYGDAGDDIFSIASTATSVSGSTYIVGDEGSDKFYFEVRSGWSADDPGGFRDFHFYDTDTSDELYWNGYKIGDFKAYFYFNESGSNGWDYADSNGFIFYPKTTFDGGLDIRAPDMTFITIEDWKNGDMGISFSGPTMGQLFDYYWSHDETQMPGAPSLEGGYNYNPVALHTLATPGSIQPPEFWI